MTVRDTLLAQRPHQCARLHNPQVEAALTGEESPERNVVMRMAADLAKLPELLRRGMKAETLTRRSCDVR